MSSPSFLGPNTNAPPDLLQEKVVLCAGEDAAELLRIAKQLFGCEPERVHSYRCYDFWNFPHCTLAWTGIGTGSIEPLLNEVLRKAPKRVREIVLIGTSGRLPNARAAALHEDAYLIEEAFLGFTALDSLVTGGLRPSFPDAERILPTARLISTDIFYTEDLPRTGLGVGRDRYEKLAAQVELVDMEVGQFYFLCPMFGGPGLKFAAIKGPSNGVGQHEEQIARTPVVIEACLRQAVRLLGLP